MHKLQVSMTFTRKDEVSVRGTTVELDEAQIMSIGEDNLRKMLVWDDIRDDSLHNFNIMTAVFIHHPGTISPYDTLHAVNYQWHALRFWARCKRPDLILDSVLTTERMQQTRPERILRTELDKMVAKYNVDVIANTPYYGEHYKLVRRDEPGKVLGVSFLYGNTSDVWSTIGSYVTDISEYKYIKGSK